VTDVANLELDQIASSQLTVESQVEHSQFPDSMFELQSHPDGPDIFQLEWRLAAGLCAIGANQVGNSVYAPATEVVQVFSVTVVLTVPGAPTILLITPGPGRLTITLQPPSNNGGGAIAGYSATCTASGHPNVTATSTTTTIVVPQLVPGVSYACTATASNGSYVSLATPATSAIPKPKVDLTPILMLLLD
jgi:hypothetical protein